ncbi:MAG: hypothetical protein OCD76_20455 [Reichenbachiella sp.]
MKEEVGIPEENRSKTIGLTILMCILLLVMVNLHFRKDTSHSAVIEPPIVRDEYEGGNKFARESVEESQVMHNALKKLQSSSRASQHGSTLMGIPAPSPPPADTKRVTSGGISGLWVERGPYNMPGCWEMTEFDSRDNTVWAMTCAHYSGPQWIWKGTLEGDDFELISAKFPNVYTDMFFKDQGGSKRLIVAILNGGISYSDNDGGEWKSATGLLDNVQSIIVNHQDNQRVYATDGQRVYESDDGAHYTVLKDFGSNKLSKLYTPRHTIMPGAERVYLAHGNDFYLLNDAQTDFTMKGTGAWPLDVKKDYWYYAIGGDDRKLYVTNHAQWYSSIDGGETWIHKPTDSWKSSTSGNKVATSPNGPDTVVLGYMDPVFSQDGMNTSFYTEYSWSGHQVWSPSNDPYRRHVIRIHADNQEVQFFYDKDGKLFTMHSTDGGIYISYKDWATTPEYWTDTDDGRYPHDIYRNIISLSAQTTEIYTPGMASGAKDPSHVVIGTQDQGTQTFAIDSTGSQWHSLQSPYGDGPHFLTGDGLTFWRVGHTEIFSPVSMYSGDDFIGVKNKNNATSGTPDAGGRYKGFYADIAQPSEILWVRGDGKLARATWNGASFDVLSKDFGSGAPAGFGQSQTDANIVYVHQNGKLYRSIDKGGVWNAGVATGISGTSASWGCGIGVRATNDQHVLIYCRSGTDVVSVYSKDGGASFSEVTGVLPNVNVAGIIVTPDGKNAIAATAMGAYAFNFETEQWYDLITGTDMPWFNAIQIEYIATTNTARFATWGSGIYDFDINNLPAIAITYPNGGEEFEQGETVALAWGDNVGSAVRIELHSESRAVVEIETEYSGNSPYVWTIPNDLTVGTDFTVVISSVTSPTVFDESDATFAITMPFVIDAFPYNQTFDLFTPGEELSDHWKQAAYEDLNWMVHFDPTPSKVHPSGGKTGPDGDHTSGDGNYLYIEASGNTPALSAEVLSPMFDLSELTNPMLTYFLHMYSDTVPVHMGEISLDILVDGSWHLDVSHFDTDYGDTWFGVHIDLSTYKGSRVQFKFRGATGLSWASDICMDDFEIKEVIPKAGLEITAPTGGSVFSPGETVSIDWDANLFGGVKIELYSNGILSLVIDSNYSGTQPYTWTVPIEQEEGDQYTIKMLSLFDFQVFDVMEESFSILPEGSIVSSSQFDNKISTGDEYSSESGNESATASLNDRGALEYVYLPLRNNQAVLYGQEGKRVQVYTILGELVFTGISTAFKTTIDFSLKARGTYFIKIDRKIYTVIKK